MKRFDFEAFDFEYSKVLTPKEYYIIFHDNYLEYRHYLILETPDRINVNEDEDDNFEDIINVETWKKETDYEEVIVKRQAISAIKHEWDKDYKIHNIIIVNGEQGELSIPFEKMGDLKEFYSYLKEWFIGEKV